MSFAFGNMTQLLGRKKKKQKNTPASKAVSSRGSQSCLKCKPGCRKGGRRMEAPYGLLQVLGMEILHIFCILQHS